MIKLSITVLAFLAVAYPLWIWFESVDFSNKDTRLLTVFPAFGLMAFSIMWLHIVGRAIKPFIDHYFNFEMFVKASSTPVLGALILHPLLFFIWLGWERVKNLFTSGQSFFIWLGVVAWFIFIGYDMAKKMQEKKVLQKHWQKIRMVSTMAFFLILFHSLKLGSHVQTGPLRFVWIFYGITAGIATIYVYGIKRHA